MAEVRQCRRCGVALERWRSLKGSWVELNPASGGYWFSCDHRGNVEHEPIDRFMYLAQKALDGQ